MAFKNFTSYGGVDIQGTTSGTVGLTAGSTPANQSYTLPSAYPASNGQVLASTTGGVMSWATASGSSTFKMGVPQAGGNFDFSIPGITPITATAAAWVQAAQRIVYQAIYVQETISLTDVGFYVQTATTLASCNAMIYIDNCSPSASTQWQPTGHLSGGYCGEITNITTTGMKTITMGSPITLTPGYYLVVVQLSNYTGTLAIASPLGRVPHATAFTIDKSTASLAIADAWQRNTVAYTSGTPAAIGNWTPTFNGSAALRNPVLMKWTVV